MKKVLSFVLALIMVLSLSAVAFAQTVEATYTPANPSVDDDDMIHLGIGDTADPDEDVTPDEPGATYYITILVGDDEFVTDENKDVLDHLTVSVTEKGDKMLKDYAIVKHNGVYKIKLTTEVFYTVAEKAADWTITMKKDGLKILSGEFDVCQAWATETDRFDDKYHQLVVFVDNADTNDGDDYLNEYTDFDNKQAKVVLDDVKVDDVVVNEIDFAEVRLVGTEVDIWLAAKNTHKVEGIVIYNEAAAPKEVWLANEEATSIIYYTFEGDFETDYMGTMHVEAAKDAFVYALVDGKYVAGEFEWNESNKCWETKSNKFIDVVVSDVELKNVVTAAGGKENPGTGSVDFVNVAVALGVVSLAAAGAVALKK